MREVYFPPKPSKQKGKQGFDCSQANQPVLITLLLFFSAFTWAPLRTSVCALLCWTPGPWLGQHALPAWPKSRSSTKHGWEKKKNREGGLKPPIWHAQKVTGWHGVMPLALGKQLSLTVSLRFIGKIIKTFSLKNIWQRLLHKSRGCFCPYRFRQRKEFKGKKQAKPHRLSSWLLKKVLKELVLWARGTPRSTPWP